jgi:hypothetical protein
MTHMGFFFRIFPYGLLNSGIGYAAQLRANPSIVGECDISVIINLGNRRSVMVADFSNAHSNSYLCLLS